MKTWQWTVVVLVCVAALVLAPLFILAGSEWTGADALGEAAIAEVAPDYVPWFSPIWEPPSAEIESLLFALQAAVGAGLVMYAFGYWAGRRKQSNSGETRETRG